MLQETVPSLGGLPGTPWPGPRPAPAPAGPGTGPCTTADVPVDGICEEWVARYAGQGPPVPVVRAGAVAHAVAGDAERGRLYVMGATDTVEDSADFALVANDIETGERLWVARYDGPTDNGDLGHLVQVVHGHDIVLMGGPSVGPSTSTDFAVVAVDGATGQERWVSRFDGPAGEWDILADLAISPDGSTLYAAGDSMVPGRHTDYAVVALDVTDGAVRWEAFYDGSGRDDGIVAADVGPQGDRVYVTGWSGRGDVVDMTTLALDAATGRTVWAARHRGGGGGSAVGADLAVSDDGRTVFVTGARANATGVPGAATVAYDAGTGLPVWASHFPGPSGVQGYGLVVRIGDAGETLFVGARLVNRFHEDHDDALLALDAATGALRWHRVYNDTGRDVDVLMGLELVPGEPAIVVTGYSLGSGLDYATAAVRSTDGEPTWTARYDGPGVPLDLATGLWVHPNGDRIYITGLSSGVSGAFEYATVAYRATGPTVLAP